MDHLKRLSSAEFDVMKTIWNMPTPATSSEIMERLGTAQRDWKPQTLITLLTRLEKKDFLRSEKPGKERLFTPIVSQESYMRLETRDFLSKFDHSSTTAFLNALFDEKGLSQQDIAELKDWLDKQ